MEILLSLLGGLKVILWNLEDIFYYFLFQFSWHDYFSIFLLFLIIDLPRYTVPNLIAGLIIILKKLGCKGKRSKYLPKVSILASALNEERVIEATIRSLLETHYPNKEIIIVDDGSSDSTYEKAYPYARRGLIKLFRNRSRQSKSAGMHLAFHASTGEIVFVMDSDTTFDRDSIRKIVEHFEDPEVGAVSGNLRPRNYDDNLLTRLQDCEYTQGISLARVWLSKLGFLFIVSGAFGAYRRELIERVGGWDAPSVGEDADMTMKARKLGYKIKFSSEAVAMTDVPNTLGVLIKQRMRWNKSFIRLRFRKHKGLWNIFHFGFANFLGFAEDSFLTLFLPFAFIIYTIFLALFQPSLIPLIAILTFASYSLANFLTLLVGILASKRRERWFLIFYAPLLVPYRFFLRLLRIWTFTKELLRLNPRESYCPDKVWDVLLSDPVLRETF